MKIGIIGNGNVANRLKNLAEYAGHQVKLSTRMPTKRQFSFVEAAEFGELIILAVPYTAVADLSQSLTSKLSNKVLIDATNPLNADWSPLSIEDGLSAGETIQQLFPTSRVVKAFNTIFADAMLRRQNGSGEPATTAFLCKDDVQARNQVSIVIKELGFTPVDAGPLSCARYLEAMAHLNIQLAVAMGGGTQGIFHYAHPSDYYQE